MTLPEDEIARRLRDEAPAEAPAEIRHNVMRRVRAEPRRRRFRLSRVDWRPLVAVAGVAAAIGLVGIGIADHGGGGEGAGGASAGRALESAGGGTAGRDGGSAPLPQVLAAKGFRATVTVDTARRVLGPLYTEPKAGVVTVRVPKQEAQRLRRALREVMPSAATSAQGDAQPETVPDTVVVRVLARGR